MQTVRDLLEPFRRAGRLLLLYWPSLLFWGLLGGALFRLSMQAAVWANGWPSAPAWLQSVLALGFLSLAILAKISTTIAMFFSVRDGMPGLRHLRFLQRETDRLIALHTQAVEARMPGRHARRPADQQAQPAGQNEPVDQNPYHPYLGENQEPRFIDFVVVAAVPFLALYSAWGYIERYMNDLSYEAMQRLDGMPFIGKDLVYGFLAAGAVAYVLKLGLWWLEGRDGWGRRLWRALAIYFEATYLFFAIYGIATFTSRVPEWLETRVVWVAATELWDDIVASFPAAELIGALVEAIGDALEQAQNTLLVPLVWLAITAVVFGHVLDREREVIAQSRFLQQFENRFRRLPGEVRFLVDNYTGESRGKWVPVVNALRLLWSAGPMLILVYTVAFLGLTVGVRWALIGVTYLIGPHDGEFWVPAVHLMEDLPQLIIGVIQACLLAAVFDIILIRRSRAAAAAARGAADAANVVAHRNPRGSAPVNPPAWPSDGAHPSSAARPPR